MWGIYLEPKRDTTLARQIYLAFRGQMTEGSLKPGEKLPSTRELARHLGISRTTACEAYEMLASEGFITSQPGSSTRVAEGLNLASDGPTAELSGESSPLTREPYQADFRTGQPDLQGFPRKTWATLLQRSALQMPLELWGYSGSEGLPELRREISAWLWRSRGMAADPENIFITTGATQALHLLAFLLDQSRSSIIVEDPCHKGMLKIFQNHLYKIQALPVDEHGLNTALLQNQQATAVYVTPSHQFPLGGILPASRRAELLRFARRQDLYIIEDDYDSEFRYSGVPVAPLFTLDPQRVIYVGTFSKLLFPSLRIGYVVLPSHFQSRWRDLRTHIDVQNPPFEQAALAALLSSRKLDRHIRLMRNLYRQKRRLLLDSFRAGFRGEWRTWGDESGLHLAVQLPGWHFDRDFEAAARSRGVYVSTVDKHSVNKGLHMDKLLLGYGHLPASNIPAAVSLLQEVLNAYGKQQA